MHLGLALALELSLFLFPQLLVKLSPLAGLVAVELCGQSSVNLAQTVLLTQLLIVLLFALGLTFELVGDGSLILCNAISMLSSVDELRKPVMLRHDARFAEGVDKTYWNLGPSVSSPCLRGSGSPSLPPQSQSLCSCAGHQPRRPEPDRRWRFRTL